MPHNVLQSYLQYVLIQHVVYSVQEMTLAPSGNHLE